MADGPSLSDPRDYVLDLSSNAGAPAIEPAATPPDSRPYLSILFKCCNAYARIHKTRDGRAYAGHCPRCARAVHVPIGPGGTSNRQFIAE